MSPWPVAGARWYAPGSAWCRRWPIQSSPSRRPGRPPPSGRASASPCRCLASEAPRWKRRSPMPRRHGWRWRPPGPKRASGRAWPGWIFWEAQAASRLLTEAARDSARVAAIAAEKLSAGTAPRVDVLRTAADAARTRADAELAAATFLQQPAAWPGHSSWRQAAAGKAALTLGEADLMTLQHGLVDHPTLRRNQAQVMAAMAHVRAEQRLRWPTLVAELTVNFRDPTLPGTDVIGGLSSSRQC